MKSKWIMGILSIFLLVGLTACSGNSDQSSSNKAAMKSSASKSMAVERSMDQAPKSGTVDKANGDKKTEVPSPENQRMIIYNAELTVVVKNFSDAQRHIQSFIDRTNGYTVQSDVSKSDNGGREGTIVARIPQPHFDDFVDEVSKSAEKVQDGRITGEDVTKQYVDLESRLRAKEAVEARLNTFLGQAKDTDDLLKISDDLASVQEEIETIKGQMNYLKNHSDLSTVTIHLVEKTVKIKDKEDLNTWDKTKNAFITSINAIVTFFSGLFIFIAGYSPILVPLVIIALVVLYLLRRKNKKE